MSTKWPRGKQIESGACSSNKLEFKYFFFGLLQAPRGEGRGRKNEMELQAYPHPSKNKDGAARTPKRTIFRSLIWGVRGVSIFRLFCPRL